MAGSYKTRLLISKILLSLASISIVAPIIFGGLTNRAQLFWLLSLPIFAYLLWSKLHGTARSVRVVGMLGIAYVSSYLILGGLENFWLMLAVLIGFIVGAIFSIRRKS